MNTKGAEEKYKVTLRVAGDEPRGTSNEAPDRYSWCFTTRASWFIPSHPYSLAFLLEHDLDPW